MPNIHWNEAKTQTSHTYTCGYCGHPLASEKGFSGYNPESPSSVAHFYLCHYCTRPTFIDLGSQQTPGVVFGNPVADIPDQSVVALYEEARKATGAGCNTAAVLCCRKLLMHIAVSKGAKPGDTFVSYVKYLADNHYVPPDASDWVDHIRKKGNEANHEITVMVAEDSKELISFIEMLLKVIFEFPASIKRKNTPQSV